MNLTRAIDALTQSRLSETLTRSAVAMQRSSTRSRKRPQPDWVREVGDISWQACLRFRHGLMHYTPRHQLPAGLRGLSRDDFAPTDAYTHDFAAHIALRAIIAAAANDDQYSDERRMAVLQRICSLELTTEEKTFLMQEIQRPLSIRNLARYGRTLHAAISIYCVSLLTADTSSPSAMLYLTALADALSLAPALVAQIHRCVDRATDTTPGSRPSSGRHTSATL